MWKTCTDLRIYPLSDAVNTAHASAVNASMPASRLVVSLTITAPSPDAVSTHAPPLAFEKLDFLQSSMIHTSSR